MANIKHLCTALLCLWQLAACSINTPRYADISCFLRDLLRLWCDGGVGCTSWQQQLRGHRFLSQVTYLSTVRQGAAPPFFSPLPWYIPLGRDQQPGWQWGGKSVFNKANEVGVNRRGTVPRPPGALPALSPGKHPVGIRIHPDPGHSGAVPQMLRGAGGDGCCTLPCCSWRGAGFSSGAVLGTEQGGQRFFLGLSWKQPRQLCGLEEAALVSSLILDLFEVFSFLNHWSAAVFSHKASVHKLNQTHIYVLEMIQEQSLTHQRRA